MRHALPQLTVVGIIAASGFQTGFAQQQPQLRPVTITFRSTSIVRTQWSADSASSNDTSSNPGGSVGGSVPNLLPEAARPSIQSSAGSSFGANDGGSTNGSNQPRPTNQQLQNPSGGFHFSHAGLSQNQYTSPNNYFGSQQHSWSNIRLQPSTLSSFESFNRFQPAMNSGAYYSPNTYMGPANNQWSNLSSGVITPNDGGGWNYQP